MRRLQFRPAASDDLEAVWDYIVEHDAGAAQRVIASIWEACTLLASSPLVGRNREDLAPNLRSFPVGNYVVFYQAEPDGIIVVRILSGARDIPALF